MGIYREEVEPFLSIPDPEPIASSEIIVTPTKFWMIAVHTDKPEYFRNKGADSPPRKKFERKDVALKIASRLAKQFNKTFYVLEVIEEIKP